MWEDGYRLGEYGKYLRNPSRFEQTELFTILRNIGFWKSGKRWIKHGFDRRWSLRKINDSISRTINLVEKARNGEALNTFAESSETKISGFGKRAGSVILAVMYPDMYGIIDYKVWRALSLRVRVRACVTVGR